MNMTFDLTIDGSTISDLLKSTVSELEGLKAVYAQLPDTRCARKTHCCSMLPEATLLEVVAVLKRLGCMADRQQCGLFARIIEYFFINPTRVSACPFLAETQCIIYEDRFFGCRAYGLWSKQHYDNMAEQGRQAKMSLAEQWRRLGVTLPEAVLDFRVPYCRDVEVLKDAIAEDGGMIQLSHEIETLSARLSPWHRIFSQQYAADLSFLIAAMSFGLQSALRMKVDIVSDLLSTADRTRLDQILNDLAGQLLPIITNLKTNSDKP
jgi:Fe-S-cluster containining protein